MKAQDPPRTVREFWDRWFQLCPRPTWGTEKNNTRMTRPWVETFGARDVDAGVSPLEAQEWTLDGHRQHARYVRTMYNDARKLGLTDSNPVADMALVLSPGPGNRDVEPPTQDEVRALAAIAGKIRGPSAEALVAVAGTTGIRQGELVQLKVPMVERLPYTRIRLPKEIVKGGRTARLVTFAPGAEWAERKLLEALPDVGRVFRWSSGAAVRCWWALVLAEHDRHVTFHALRHGAATWLVENGHRPEDVALMLWGRRNTDLLFALYAHPNAEAAADRMRGAG